MSDLLIRGGTVVDETATRTADVLIRDGRIVEVGAIVDRAADTGVLDATGCIVSPGLVDLHVHLRQPGFEQSETVETGTRAAALGGFTAVIAMPNTEPACDNPAIVREVRALAAAAGLCDVHPAGSITLGRNGLELTGFAEMAQQGVHLFTDDGFGVQDPLLMRRAMEYTKPLGITLAQHCEVSRLTEGAVMNEGCCSSALGLPGWPSIAEELMVHRDIELARLTGAPLHILHLSTARSVELVRAAKRDGLAITAECTPHHFTLTDESLRSFDPVFKVNPPLRTAADVVALKQGLRDGTIDAIATDHAPHTQDAKERPLDEAPPGMLGLETALALALTELDLPIERVLALLSWQPARIARLAEHGRPIATGEPANLCVIDLEHTWTIAPAQMASKSRNTPFAGRELQGKVRHTVLAGVPVVVDGKAQR
jgi:dihydroorotase